MSASLFVLVALAALALVAWLVNARVRSNLPPVGAPAPAFSLPDQTNATRTLEEFRGRRVVLYFYPRDDTPGCAEQAMRFRNAIREIEALGAAVCGISVDDAASHAAFARKYNLPFTLLSDARGATAARYGSLFTLGVVRFARRNTFVIGPDGLIEKVYLGVSAARNADEVVGDLRA